MNTVEGRVSGDGFPKCSRFDFEKTKTKDFRRWLKEPPMMPLNGGFTESE
jgi:hypothetical protein